MKLYMEIEVVEYKSSAERIRLERGIHATPEPDDVVFRIVGMHSPKMLLPKKAFDKLATRENE